ncbi:hypothetical protein [Frigoriflavimonas asaccharolytica]|uniref:Uncharacterized protein n=1 Tax=Frigoriflavimonas asaccharolytica TaxID=2735899 RepID=A0A8J8KAA7_9FLAO|nr:hypothetical protein [Frigoriflavimonas asaccharolytica]NRS93962.1 hypothetical protein [Frigoriflavimonas asaccharolytica]
MYKKIFTILTLAVITGVNAQVIIGDNVGTASNKTSVLLEFANGQNKGIILPYVKTLPTGSALVGGTIILDATTSPANSPVTTARVKYYNGTSWIDLSGQDANLSSPNNFMADQPSGVTETGKAIIGAETSIADGVLVLESNTKAMVLPQVAKVGDIPRPSPGMMVFVTGVSPDFNKRLAVFNGAKWSFWKP